MPKFRQISVVVIPADTVVHKAYNIVLNPIEHVWDTPPLYIPKIHYQLHRHKEMQIFFYNFHFMHKKCGFFNTILFLLFNMILHFLNITLH